MYASKKPPQEPDHLEPYDRSLHRLTLIQDRGARPAPFDLLLRLFKRYEELKIHGVHICNYKTLPPRYPPLQHFGLPGPEMLSSFELFVHSAIPLFLEQMVNLEAFYLVLVSKTGIMDTTVPDRLCSAGLIPRNIQLFSIRHQGYQSDFTPDFLAMKRCTPSLRRIQLDFRFGDHQQQKELAQRLKDVGVELDITMNVL